MAWCLHIRKPYVFEPPDVEAEIDALADYLACIR